MKSFDSLSQRDTLPFTVAKEGQNSRLNSDHLDRAWTKSASQNGGPPNNKGHFIDVELFAGAGGLTLGLVAAGLPPDHLFELSKHCCATLRRNTEGAHPRITGAIHQEDVSKVNWRGLQRPVRLLSGGPPCQPFSFAGKHLAARDGRNQFPATLRAIRDLRPEAVLLENVPGLIRASFRPYLDFIARQLECPSVAPRSGEHWGVHDKRLREYQRSRGYQAEYHVRRWVLNAADFGVAQARVRVFLVATRAEFAAIDDPIPTHSRAALMRYQESGAYWRDRGLRPRTREEWPRRAHGQSGRLGAHLEPWCTVRDALRGLKRPPKGDGGDNHWLIPGARLYDRHSGSELDWPAKTIKAGVHGVAGGENVLVLDDDAHRYFTLREMARLQGFPDDHVFEGPRSRIIGQIGNAVPCRLACIIGELILRALGRHRGTTNQPAARISPLVGRGTVEVRA